MKKRALATVTALFFLFITGCAVTYTEEQPGYDRTRTTAPLPEYHGPKTVVAVLPLGLSKRAASRYPQLLTKDVGLGIHNRVTESLYDTNRFRFVEEKPEIIKDVLRRQWMSGAGMVEQGTAVEIGHLLGASRVVYGEVYDFSQGGEKIGLSGREAARRTRVGVQIRLVNATTLEYLPASGVGYGRDVGEASQKAIHDAVANLVRRLEQKAAAPAGE